MNVDDPARNFVAREITLTFAIMRESLGDGIADRLFVPLAYSPPMARSIASIRF
jgi:hypothetical protein